MELPAVQARLRYSYIANHNPFLCGHLNGLSEVVQAIGFLKAAIPDLTFSHGTRQKLWTVMLHKMPTPVLGALLYSKQMLLKRIHRAAQGPNGA